MAKAVGFSFRKRVPKKRPNRHSKNASKGQTGYKSNYRGQGKYKITPFSGGYLNKTMKKQKV